jgi:sugar-specific transcriptional regulator TrmB
MLASNRVMDALKGIGLNLYERKLWTALLARGTSTAGELSEIAGVPRSRAYDVLQSLADKGFVVVQNAKPIRYVATNPEEALDRVKGKMESDLKSVLERIDEMKSSPIMKELTEIFNSGMKVVSSEELTGALKGRHLVKQHMDAMFKSARRSINILTTPEGIRELHDHHYDSLKRAKDNGATIKIATVADATVQNFVKTLGGVADIRHMENQSVNGRFCIIDGREMLMGLSDPKVEHDTQHVAIWSKSEHAAANVLDPIFEMVWNNAKPIS